MKIHLLSGWAIAVALILSNVKLYSQYHPEPIQPMVLKAAQAETPITISPDNIIFYEDFDGALPVGWVNTDLSGYCGFSHTYTGSRGPLSMGMSPLNSTSANNGFMILDSDLCSSQRPGGITNAFLESPAINIRGQTKIMLRFQHNFRYCCNPATSLIMVEVSNDRENWTSFDVRNGLRPNNISRNPHFQSIDLSAFTGVSEQLWIRFRKTGASHYWWMIDDVILESFTDNDIQITSVEYNHGYTQVPDGLQQPFAPRARVRNAGSLPQTQVVLNTIINRFLYDFNSEVIANFVSGHEATITVQQQFQAPGRGIYNIEFLASQTQVDQSPANNTQIGSFAITDSIYSRSRNFYSQQVFTNLSDQGISAVGNRFTIIKQMEATSVSFVLHENSQVGKALRAKVYRLVADVFNLIAVSDEYIITPGDISTVESYRWVSIGFAQPVNLVQGEYVVVVSAIQDGVSVAAQNPEIASVNHSWSLNNGQWENKPVIPMVNLNFGNNLGTCAPLYHLIVTDSECGRSTGSVGVIPLTGTGPYTYNWKDFPENRTPNIENIPGGVYSLIITDGNGCEASLDVSVGNLGLEVKFESFEAFCGVNGAIELIPANGVGPFTYAWSHNAGLNSATATGLLPGKYTIKVTDSNNCQGTIEVEVKSNYVLPVDIHTTDSFCEYANGTIQITPLSGEGPYTFKWDLFTGVSTGVLTDLKAGSYTFTVTDAKNCSFSGAAVVGNTSYEVEITSNVVNASCGLNNGQISLTTANGQMPFTYNWSTGLATAEVANLFPGTYTVTVTDRFGCKGTETIVISNSGIMPEVTLQTQNSSGCGQSTGSFLITPANPAHTFIYSLLQDDGKSFSNFSNQNLVMGNGAFSLNNLAPGRYRISVVNNDGCERIVTVDISDEGGPDIIAATGGIKNISCFGRSDGSITIRLENGGTNPTYLWNDPGQSTTPTISGLGAGTYTVKVINNEGCTSVASFRVMEPAPIMANAILTHPLCTGDNNGRIQLSLNGGTLPISFLWNTGATTRNVSGLGAGIYTVSITDFNYCTFTNNFTLTAPEKLALSYTVVDVPFGESNGSIEIVVSGGAGNYNYSWNTGQNTPIIAGLQPGSYTITVSDANGCELVETITVVAVNVPLVVQNEMIMLYPNPARNELYVELDFACTSIGTIELYNIAGERVYANIHHVFEGNIERFKIDVNNLPPGVYIVRLRCAENTWHSKFLKQ